MAQFRGTIRGQRGEASRLGSKSSGLVVTASGWDAGVRVSVHHNAETGRDVFHVYRTGGSNRRTSDVLIACFEDGPAPRHSHVVVGRCVTCGHYGDDCTGER